MEQEKAKAEAEQLAKENPGATVTEIKDEEEKKSEGNADAPAKTVASTVADKKEVS
jgi:hypothetical protein